MTSQTPHPATIDPDELLQQCDVRRVRRSGPGGQRRNKVETAVALRHRPTGVEAEASERRSQAENQAIALRRLRLNLALQIRSPHAREGGPSSLWRSRLQKDRVQVNPSHADFPALLAEALDVVLAEDGNVAEAARRLRCTTSQLIKFLKLEPRALALINRRRQQLGRHPLK